MAVTLESLRERLWEKKREIALELLDVMLEDEEFYKAILTTKNPIVAALYERFQDVSDYLRWTYCNENEDEAIA
ncbi:MAG: hypothetical protein IMW95_11065 [Moorella humiferrea]|nr:hypothetical protein [Moorella humiferrea]